MTPSRSLHAEVSAIALCGAGCVLATGIGVDALWGAACAGRSGIRPLQSKHFRSTRIAAFGHVSADDHARCLESVPRHLQRYCTPSVIWGVSAVQQSLHEAGLDPSGSGLRFGLYTSQGGYTHPSLDAYAELLQECSAAGKLNIRRLAARILQESALDPFLVLKSLSNGLLGIVSLCYKLEAQCGAYMQGVAGNQAALREACSALRERRIDVAIVVAAGSEMDALALTDLVRAGAISCEGAMAFTPYDSKGRGGIGGEGAAALILRRQDDLEIGHAVCLTEIKAHTDFDALPFADTHVDLLISHGAGIPGIDKELCAVLARTGATHISNSQALTGILSGSPSLVDLIFAREALRVQQVPAIAGLKRAVMPALPFACHTKPASLRHALILNRDSNGFSAGYRLERRCIQTESRVA
ncbi:MAG: beta-ketoacyl synthase N-terminal-like domain-containing protein [Pseudomonadota bacterium]